MMSESAHRIALRHLTSTARKVLGAVPAAEAWNSQQIAAEVRRQGYGTAFTIVEGCLKSLASDGLVLEPKRGQFVLAGVRRQDDAAPQHQQETQTMTAANPSAAPAKKANLTEQLGSFSEQLRNMAKSMNTLADCVDEVAIEADEAGAADMEELKKLRALRDILKSV